VTSLEMTLSRTPAENYNILSNCLTLEN